MHCRLIVQIALALSGTNLVLAAPLPHLPISPSTQGRHCMISTNNYYASTVGYEVLKSGGNAVDTMVAVQMMQGVVDPAMSGLGGGTFALVYIKEKNIVQALDGRETAPQSAYPDMFLDKKKRPLERKKVVGVRQTAVPGTLKLLHNLHQQYGSKPWRELLQPAIDRAREGYLLTSFTHQILAREAHRLKKDPGLSELFWNKNGNLVPPGTVIKNPQLAKTLELIADQGSKPFYEGEIAKKIVSEVNQKLSGRQPKLALSDFKQYRVRERRVIESTYGGYTLKGVGYPASGAVMIAQTLKLLEPFNLSKRSATDPESWRLITEALRLTEADRLQYAADPDFVDAPVDVLLSETYLSKRMELIPKSGAMRTDPSAGRAHYQYAENPRDNESSETAHVSIVDRQGNAVSYTSTIGTGMGAGVLVDGFVLNAEMGNFSKQPEKNSRQYANRIEPGKRPRSAMAPMMLFNPDGSLKLVTGSPGSSQIPGYVIKSIIGVVDWGLNIQESINLPNIQHGTLIDHSKPKHPQGLLVEKNSIAEWMTPSFTDFGYDVIILPVNSGLQAIEIGKTGILGAADPRKGGFAMGE